MRNTEFVIFAFFLACFCGFAEADMFFNGDFENGTMGWINYGSGSGEGAPSYWSCGGWDDCCGSIVDSNGSDGGKYVVLETPAITPPNWGWAWCSIWPDEAYLPGGGELIEGDQVSGCVKVKNDRGTGALTDAFAIDFHWRNESGGLILQETYLYDVTDTWGCIEYSTIAPEGTFYVDLTYYNTEPDQSIGVDQVGWWCDGTSGCDGIVACIDEITGDDIIDLQDIARIAEGWLDDYDLQDLILLIDDWLCGT